MSNLRHGAYRTRAYWAWHNMNVRCYWKKSPDYKNYGARGIRVCKRWRHSFENFLADMGQPGDGMMLDRSNNNKSYSPKNCRWVSRKIQNRNKRGLIRIQIGKQTKILSEWCELFGVKPSSATMRIKKYGWEPALAVSVPAGRTYQTF